MSSLTAADKSYLEAILDMRGGYVLCLNDAQYGALFDRYGVEIHGCKYQTYGPSKAKKMRAFWQREPDDLVGRVLSELLDNYEVECNLGRRERDPVVLAKCRNIVARLQGRSPVTQTVTADGFLDKEFTIPDIEKLPVELPVAEIIRSRLKEAQSCLGVGAYLAVIFHCGSVLEAVLLGAAQKEPEKFNRAHSSPKRDGKPMRFPDWSLADLINVAREIGLLKPDVHKFSHGLRDFRNYIHPYQQMISDFTPDEHTARVCLQVLKAALADVAGERK